VASEKEEGSGGPRELVLRDLRLRPEPIIILAKVVRSERREYTRASDGSRRTKLTGLLTDGTATVRFTWWDPPEDPIDPGGVLRVGPIQLGEYRGRLEVAFNRRTHVEPASPVELSLPTLDSIPVRVLAELGDAEEEIRVDVQVEPVRSRTVMVRGTERPLREGILQDASGHLPFVAWVDRGLSKGSYIRVAGAYIRTFRGRMELILDERARIELRTLGSP
jgi:ssDNA-binding replication factor A large subunit